MTPQQWLVSTLTPVIQSNNPQASADECLAYATQLATFYLTYILPNINANPSTGVITFNVPSS